MQNSQESGAGDGLNGGDWETQSASSYNEKINKILRSGKFT
jgi:hypothetical protein